MIAVGGEDQPRADAPIQRGQDKSGIYRKACAEIAAEINWESDAVTFHWSQIAMAREYENHEPRAIAEFLALRNVREALDCRGREAS